jgi:hypothetical protein
LIFIPWGFCYTLWSMIIVVLYRKLIKLNINNLINFNGKITQLKFLSLNVLIHKKWHGLNLENQIFLMKTNHNKYKIFIIPSIKMKKQIMLVIQKLRIWELHVIFNKLKVYIEAHQFLFILKANQYKYK